MTQRRTREQWSALMLAYDRSSQSAAAFCATRGLTLRPRLQELPGASLGPNERTRTFVSSDVALDRGHQSRDASK